MVDIVFSGFAFSGGCHRASSGSFNGSFCQALQDAAITATGFKPLRFL